MDIMPFLEQYEHIISDVCGVLHNYHKPIGQASQILQNTQANVSLLSNHHMPSTVVRKILADRFQITGFEHIVTSGDYALHAQKTGILPSLEGKLCFVLPQRAPHLADIFKYTETASLNHAQFLLAFGVPNVQGSHTACHKLLHQAEKMRIPLVCFNPDIFINHNQSRALRPGLLAKYYQAIGGRVYQCGKPDPSIYQFVCQKAVLPRKLLCIGDGMTTDAVGAQAIQRDFLLTASGNPALTWDHSQSMQKNISTIMEHFQTAIPYATWNLSHNALVHNIKFPSSSAATTPAPASA